MIDNWLVITEDLVIFSPVWARLLPYVILYCIDQLIDYPINCASLTHCPYENIVLAVKYPPNTFTVYPVQLSTARNGDPVLSIGIVPTVWLISRSRIRISLAYTSIRWCRHALWYVSCMHSLRAIFSSSPLKHQKKKNIGGDSSG